MHWEFFDRNVVLTVTVRNSEMHLKSYLTLS